MRLAGYARADGRKGIRNVLVVAYLVECAHHVAREIVAPFRDESVHLIGFPGCYPNAYALAMMEKLCTHPNVGGALLVSLGCEGFDKRRLARAIEASGRPVATLGIQQSGGTRSTIAAGREWVTATLPQLRAQATVPMRADELTVGTICGGSDATSGLTANPAMGVAFDLLVAEGAKTIFEETGELIGMEHLMAARAKTQPLGEELKRTVAKAAGYYATLGYASFAPGNADGGLTTIEEKSLGAIAKAGSRPIQSLLQLGEAPSGPGLHLMDGPGFSPESLTGFAAAGAQIMLFTTGPGNSFCNALAPTLKISAHPDTAARLPEQIDFDASPVLAGQEPIDAAADRLLDLVLDVASGGATWGEVLEESDEVLARLGPSF